MILFKEKIISGFNKIILSNVEYLMSKLYFEEIKFRPIFILGTPRSGTTLLMQTLKYYFDISYINNFTHRYFFGCPFISELFFSRLSFYDENFTSNYGRTKGLIGPHEGSNWWYRFFNRKPRYVATNNINFHKMERFKSSIRLLTNFSGKNVVFKNPHASLRLNPINSIFPDALFIRIYRDKLDNAHSILKARKDNLGSYNKWWSMDPPGYEDLLSLPPYVQVVEQINLINNLIDQDIKKNAIDKKYIHELSYEDLCEKPSYIINQIHKFFIKNSTNIPKKNISLPSKFEMRNTINIDHTLYQDLINYVQNH